MFVVHWQIKGYFLAYCLLTRSLMFFWETWFVSPTVISGDFFASSTVCGGNINLCTLLNSNVFFFIIAPTRNGHFQVIINSFLTLHFTLIWIVWCFIFPMLINDQQNVASVSANDKKHN